MSSARPTLPDILRVSQEFAAALDGREAAAFQQMSDAYVRIEQRLLTEADALLRDIMEKGYTASRAQQLTRYKALLRQIKEQEEQYASFTSQVITNEQQAAVTLALQEAEMLSAMSLPGPMAGLMTSWNKLPVDAIQAFVGFAGDGSPLMPALQARFGEAVSGAVKETLLQGIALGWHPTKTVRKMGEVLNGGMLNNALTWARTETVRASREASRRTYEANPNVVRGVIRHATLDSRTCGGCIMMDGTYYPRNADGTMPEIIDHPRGRCVGIPATVGYAELLGIDLDEGPRVDWQTGPEWVKAMPPAEQRIWLDTHIGKGAGDAFAAGKFDLADIPKLNKSKAWGDSYTTKSLSDILKGKAGATGATVAPVKAQGLPDIAATLESAKAQHIPQEAVVTHIMGVNPPVQVATGKMSQAEWVDKFMSNEPDGYVLARVHPKSMYLPMEAGNKEAVQSFAKMPGKNAPPIVVDSNDKIEARFSGGKLDRAFGLQPHTVIDGKHRLEAALLRGDESIPAIVPKRKISQVWKASHEIELNAYANAYFAEKGYPIVADYGDRWVVLRQGVQREFNTFDLERIAKNKGHEWLYPRE